MDGCEAALEAAHARVKGAIERNNKALDSMSAAWGAFALLGPRSVYEAAAPLARGGTSHEMEGNIGELEGHMRRALKFDYESRIRRFLCRCAR